MRDLGLGLIVITNQSGIERGYFTEETLDKIHSRMNELLEAEGVKLDDILYCPHLPGGCGCRKPQLGLLKIAMEKHKFEMRNCYVIGDNFCDLDFGMNAGVPSFLVKTGYGAEIVRKKRTCYKDIVVEDLKEASDQIERFLTIDDLIGEA